MTDVALENNGIVDKFIGDGALLIFGLNSDISQAAKDALACARNILRATERWNDARKSEGLCPIDLAIGVHTGPAIIGAVGDTRRLEFTAIGTTVNLASRLEEVAKKHNKNLVVSRSTLDLVGAGADDFRPIGLVDLRGSSQAMEVLAL